MRTDRRDIAPLLTEHFPTMANASSDDWHAFLNAQTGLDVLLMEENPTAFDKWRQALAIQGFPVWNVTEQHVADIAARGAILKAKEDKRVAAQAVTLATLAVEAPQVSAATLMAPPKP